MANKRDVLCENKFYHIYNHAVGDDNLFKTRNDYITFLNKINTHTISCFDIYCYCLMPNHFHFLLKVKSHEDLILSGYNEKDNIHNYLSHKLGNLFNSYSKIYNLIYDRKGSLFNESFHRIAINSEEYLRKLVVYIHLNPVTHGFVDKPEDWTYSSFKSIYHNTRSKKEYDIVISWFNDRENYLYNHRIIIDLDDNYKLGS